MHVQDSFNLISLMVIIAIIAILLVVGLRAYKQYLIHVSISEIVRAFDGLAQRSQDFARSHKRFANASDLGMSPAQVYPAAGYWDVDDTLGMYVMPYYLPQSRNGYVLIEDDSSGWGNMAHPCGKRGLIAASLDTHKMGFNPKEVDYFYIEYNLWNENGMVQKNCTYEYGNSQMSQNGDLIPECINLNVGFKYDAKNWQASNNYIDENSTCMR